jgi:hypothetical protein
VINDMYPSDEELANIPKHILASKDIVYHTISLGMRETHETIGIMETMETI